MLSQTGSQEKLGGKAQQQRGLGTAVQGAFGWLAPRAWGVGHKRTGAQPEHVSSQTSNHRADDDVKPDHHRTAGLELSTRQSSASVSADGASAPDCSMQYPELSTSTRPASDAARFAQGSVSRASSTGSLGAATNDGHSTASGSSHPARYLSTVAPSAAGHSSTAAGDDLCSMATQAGSAAHSFNSLRSMMTTTQADISVDGGSLIGTAPAPAAGDRALLLPSSPTAAGSSNMSLLSAYRSSDAGGDGASVSTLPLISELGFDERMQDVQTLAEEHDSDADRKEGSVESGPDPSGDITQPRSRLSSGHGSYSNLTSSSCDLAGSLGPGPAARIPSPANSRMSHNQRSSSSKHSFQQQLQQQLLQDLEESQEEGTISTCMPVPFSSRKRPENDDMCSYATQAGSPVHSLSSVMSHLDNHLSQRQQWSSDGNAMLPGTGSSRSLSSYQQQYGSSRSRRTSAEIGGHPTTTATAAAAAAPVQLCESSAVASQVSRGLSARSSLAAAAQGGRGQVGRDAAQGLQRKSSLKGAFRAVTKWGSGITQRLQRSGSGGTRTTEQQQQTRAASTGAAAAGRSGRGASDSTTASNSHEMVHWPRDLAQ